MRKVKIAFVDYKLVCGGAEQALFDLINLLDKETFQVSVFVQDPGGSWEKKFWDTGIPLSMTTTAGERTGIGSKSWAIPGESTWLRKPTAMEAVAFWRCAFRKSRTLWCPIPPGCMSKPPLSPEPKP